ncbi:MAG TPA: AmpG family muropeptide MFS transporter [Sphingomonadales bacterium]|nr:AmpG family muropeptide MFS transporter [Sphingomonadales bacterium]
MKTKTPWTVYFQPKILAVLALGFSGGLPLALSASTLFVWMREVGVDLTTIGIFAAAGTPYTVKFLWSPLVDQMRLPVLTRLFGRRRSWLIFSQALLILAIIALGFSHPSVNPWMTAFLAFMVAFLSATQDIVIDAFRIEKLEPDEQAAGAATYVWGYRIGMLVSGFAPLYLASYFSWGFAYAAMAALVLVGTAAALLSAEPKADGDQQEGETETFPEWIQRAVIDPFVDFLKRKGWVVILLFITLFKLGDALVGTMTNPFLVDIGFSLTEIANVAKLFGFWATMIGLGLGGLLLAKVSLFKALIISFIVQMGSTIMFVVQAHVGYNLELLAATIAAENVASGMGTAVFVAFLSILCNVRYTATQYALFSSLFAISRTWLSTGSGALAEQFGWAPFFVLTIAAAIPGIILLFVMRYYDGKETGKRLFT